MTGVQTCALPIFLLFPSHDKYNKLGYKLLDAMWNNDNTLYVNTLRYEGERIQNKRNNKKEAPLNSEENFTNDKSE